MENRTKSRNEHSSCRNLWVLVYDTTLQGKGRVIHREFREFWGSRRQKDESEGAFPEGFLGDLEQERALVPRERSSWKRAGKGPKPLPQSGIWERFSHFSFRKKVLAGIWGIPSQSRLFWDHYSFAKGKISFSLLFSSSFPAFSCSFPPPAPSGMSSRVSEFPARGPPEIPGVWNRLLPNKTHQKHSQTGKEFQEKQRKANRKGGFCWKSFPGPVRLWEFLGSARNRDRESQIPQNPTFPGKSRQNLGSSQPGSQSQRGLGSSQSQFHSQSHSHLSLGHQQGLGDVLCTRRQFQAQSRFPGVIPEFWECCSSRERSAVLRADPGIPGTRRFLGTLSSARRSAGRG